MSAFMYSIIIDGIEITAQNKKIKNMYIRVSPPDGTVKITAPLRASKDTVRTFAQSRIEWIKKQREKIVVRPAEVNYRYVTDEVFYLWGRSYLLNVVCGSVRNAVYIEGKSLVLQVSNDSSLIQRAAVIKEWYRKTLKEAIPTVLAKCERIVSVTADDWRIKDMRTRWGTCNIPERRIWLSLQLAKKTPECLEYVIIHELVHLLERSHNERFRLFMDRFCPDWRTIRASLNDQKLSC